MAPSAVNGDAVVSQHNGDGNGNGKESRLIRHSPSVFAHCVLRTTPDNYQGMTKFYIDLLNAHIVHQDPVLTFLRYDEEHHRIAIVADANAQPRPKGVSMVGTDHFAFTYPTLTALAQQYLFLKSMDRPLLPSWTVNHGPTTSMYYFDPDGNKIELQVDNFEIPEEADAFMSGPKYDENPIGTDFDPDEWAREVLSKVKPNGEEGLTAQEVKDKKARKDMGDRHSLPPEFFFNKHENTT